MPISDPKTLVRILGALAWLFFLPCALLFRSLAIDDFVPRQWLIPAYIAYCLTVVLWLYALVFYLHLDSKVSRGTGLSKRVPKYIDYIVTALLTIGVLQISFADNWLGKYIDARGGDKAALIEKIRTQAERHLTHDCGRSSYFSITYCSKLRLITSASDLPVFIKATLFNDTEFLNHTTGIYLTGYTAFSATSPIRDYVNRYRSLLEYEGVGGNEGPRTAWNWLALLLLPAVIGFRALKTSLELYADLA